jgi:hypothetical protein
MSSFPHEKESDELRNTAQQLLKASEMLKVEHDRLMKQAEVLEKAIKRTRNENV